MNTTNTKNDYLIGAIAWAISLMSAVSFFVFWSHYLTGYEMILPIISVAVIEFGAHVWHYFYTNKANGETQRTISLVMIAVNVAVTLSGLSLTLWELAAKTGLIPLPTHDHAIIVMLSLFVGLAVNACSAFACALSDPERRKVIARREAFDAIDRATITAIKSNAQALAAELAPKIAAQWVLEQRTFTERELDNRNASLLLNQGAANGTPGLQMMTFPKDSDGDSPALKPTDPK